MQKERVIEKSAVYNLVNYAFLPILLSDNLLNGINLPISHKIYLIKKLKVIYYIFIDSNKIHKLTHEIKLF